MVESTTVSELGAIAQRVGVEAAGPAAADVDAKARFPSEAIDALRRERLLSAYVPTELGGGACSITELGAVCTALGQHCAAAAMVFAMHQIQVACLVRHGLSSPPIRDYLRELSERQLLVASATSEIGVGGDVRTSLCAVEDDGATFRLTKQAPVISYGEHADDVLVTARRTPTSAGSDQVLVLARRQGLTLERTGPWDTLGMRGTCSLGFKLHYEGPVGHVLPVPYGDVSSQTMLPVSHIVWSSLWLGIATDAVSRARAYIRAEARKKPGTTPPGALRLAEVVVTLQMMRATVQDATSEYERVRDDPEALGAMGFAIRMNNLKVAASRLMVEIVTHALSICGIAGYRNDSKFSLGRQLRDAHGASLMVANDRIYGANASLLLVHKDD